MLLPKSRDTDVIIQNADKELLIYDLKINKILCLNETSKIIYQSCDGKTSFDELKSKQRHLNDDVILLGINELNRQNLLVEKTENGLSRRQLFMRAAATAIALPVITTIIAPTSAHAQSCVAGGLSCNINNPASCCSKTCLSNGGNPICASTCTAGGGSCNINDPAGCCSGNCLSNGGNPICGGLCTPNGGSCNLNDPGTCCSLSCFNNNGNPICG